MNEHINESSFCQLCKYGYFSLVKILLASINIDINDKVIIYNEIKNNIFQWHSKSYLSTKFKIIFFNYIQNFIFQYDSKLCLSITFKITFFNEI